MNEAQIHLALNHFPIAGTILTFGVLLWGFFSKKDQIKIVGIALMIVCAATGLVVAQTGEGAEELVEHKPLVTEALIQSHESAADNAMIAIDLTAVLGIAWLVMYRMKKNHLDKIFVLMMASNLAGALLVADAAHKGGQIRHDEIRDGNVPPAVKE
jgi:uncharacterized membrane protein